MRRWDNDLRQFWSALNEPATTRYILRRFADQRARAKSHLQQEGLFDHGVAWALVDLGWHLSVQQALNRLVPQEVQAQGLYIYLEPDRAPPSTTGSAFAMFPHVRFDAEHVGSRPTVAKAVLVSEHIFGLAPHGPVLGYRQDGGPWTGVCQSLPPGGVTWRRTMADLMDEFVAEHGTRFLGALSDPADCAVLFEESTASMLGAPDRIAVRCLAEHVAISSDHHDQDPIARPFTLAEAALFLWQTARAAK